MQMVAKHNNLFMGMQLKPLYRIEASNRGSLKTCECQLPEFPMNFLENSGSSIPQVLKLAKLDIPAIESN